MIPVWLRRFGLALLTLACSGLTAEAMQPARSTAQVRITRTAALDPGNIIGVVYDQATGHPIKGAQVGTRSFEKGAVTDTSGVFRLRLDARNTVQMLAQVIGYRPAEFEIVMSNDSAIALEIGLKQAENQLCGLMICSGPFGCYSQIARVRDMSTGKAPATPVTFRLFSSHEADSSVVSAAAEAPYAEVATGGRLQGREQAFWARVTAAGYYDWQKADIWRDSCGVFSQRFLYVWLIPKAD